MNRNLTPRVYQQFSEYLQQQSGIVLGDAKQYLVRSRLIPLMHQFSYQDINLLIVEILSGRNSALSGLAVDAMTTNETLWFRDKYPFDILSQKLLPALDGLSRPLRIWSAACSSGQEPYSIAMLMLEYKRQNLRAFSGGVDIVATDLSPTMLKIARSGMYDELSLGRGLSSEMKQRYFHARDNKHMEIDDAVKKMVTFKHFNLLTSFAGLGKFDVVFCRNVLIYFDIEQKTQVLQNITALLPPQGALLLGASESLAGASPLFKMLTHASGLYYSKH